MTDSLLVVLAGAASLALVLSLVRLTRPRPVAAVAQRPIRIKLPAIRPEEDAERLIDGLARASTLGRVQFGVAITAGDVPISARYVFDLSSTRLGQYRVQLGQVVWYAGDLDQVYALVRDHLAGIVEERRSRRVAS